MKIHPLIAAIILTAILYLQNWTVREVVNLKVQVDALASQTKNSLATR